MLCFCDTYVFGIVCCDIVFINFLKWFINLVEFKNKILMVIIIIIIQVGIVIVIISCTR